MGALTGLNCHDQPCRGPLPAPCSRPRSSVPTWAQLSRTCLNYVLGVPEPSPVSCCPASNCPPWMPPKPKVLVASLQLGLPLELSEQTWTCPTITGCGWSCYHPGPAQVLWVGSLSVRPGVTLGIWLILPHGTALLLLLPGTQPC